MRKPSIFSELAIEEGGVLTFERGPFDPVLCVGGRPVFFKDGPQPHDRRRRPVERACLRAVFSGLVNSLYLSCE